MLEPALVLIRLVQYAGVTILFGSSIFLLMALPPTVPESAAGLRWPRPLLSLGAGLVMAGSLLGLPVQTAVMAGSFAEGLRPSTISFFAGDTAIGRAGLVRAILAALALTALAIGAPGRRLWWSIAILGAVTCVSLAWMGHGATTEGAAGVAHLASDSLHAMAAAAWIGALIGFLAMLRPRRTTSPSFHVALHGALKGFSGFGSVLVAVLVLTGIVNSVFLVGADGSPDLLTTLYGRLLLLKLGLFGVMLLLAAANRLHLTPGLNAAPEPAGGLAPSLSALRKSIGSETAIAFAILALVAWLGTLAPISSL